MFLLIRQKLSSRVVCIISRPRKKKRPHDQNDGQETYVSAEESFNRGWVWSKLERSQVATNGFEQITSGVFTVLCFDRSEHGDCDLRTRHRHLAHGVLVVQQCSELLGVEANCGKGAEVHGGLWAVHHVVIQSGEALMQPENKVENRGFKHQADTQQRL